MPSRPGSPTIRDPFGSASEFSLSPSPSGLIPSRRSIPAAFRINSPLCRRHGLATSTSASPPRISPMNRLRRRHSRLPPLPRTIQNPALRRRPQHFRLLRIRLNPKPPPDKIDAVLRRAQNRRTRPSYTRLFIPDRHDSKYHAEPKNQPRKSPSPGSQKLNSHSKIKDLKKNKKISPKL